MKINDVYKLQYTEAYKKTQSPHTDFNHCFERLGVVVENHNDNLIIVDTFWGIKDSEGRKFNLDDIGKIIDIELIGNLDNYETLESSMIDYYADDDLMRLSRQHGCSQNCVYFYKKKGSSKSAEKMSKIINDRIAGKESDILFSTRELKRLKEMLIKVDDGYTEDVYI